MYRVWFDLEKFGNILDLIVQRLESKMEIYKKTIPTTTDYVVYFMPTNRNVHNLSLSNNITYDFDEN